MSVYKILNKFGFNIVPAELKSLYIDEETVCDWFSHINFDDALSFYRLNVHKKFMSLFSCFENSVKYSIEIKTIIWALNNYLFSSNHYGWEHSLKRTDLDILPAFILLSGYKKHQINIKKSNFDTNQIEIHKKRIFECCTIGLDTYHIYGVELSQLIWGSIFINTHIIEQGCLQFEIKKYEYNFQNILLKDKFCIGIHIPRGQRLQNNKLEETFQQIQKDILSYFRELESYPIYILDSWLLSNDLDKFLPDNSNISLFRKRFNILGYKSHSSIPKFLFNSVSLEYQNYPENTSLQYLIKKALLNGHQFYDGIGILRA